MTQAAAEATAVSRLSSVHDALGQAQSAFEQGSAQRVLKALQSVDTTTFTRSSRRTPRPAPRPPPRGRPHAGRGRGPGHAGRGVAPASFAAALLILTVLVKAGALAARATQGQKLSARLAEAQDAARRGQWRKALSLALALRAAQPAFPARPRSSPRRTGSPAPAGAQARHHEHGVERVHGAGGGASSGTSSGSSSGSSSQPPPPSGCAP